jgi:hypothetical protein
VTVPRNRRTEVSERGGAPDLKDFIEPTDAEEPRFVPSSQIEDYREQIELAKTEARQAKEQAQQRVEKQVTEFRSTYPATRRFGYKFQRDRKPSPQGIAGGISLNRQREIAFRPEELSNRQIQLSTHTFDSEGNEWELIPQASIRLGWPFLGSANQRLAGEVALRCA